MVLLRVLDLRKLLLYYAELLQVLWLVPVVVLAPLTFDELADMLVSFLVSKIDLLTLIILLNARK